MPTSPFLRLPQSPHAASEALVSGLSPFLSQEAAKAPMSAGAKMDTSPIAFILI
jgi:hypothetical protein